MTSPLNWKDFLKQADLPDETECLQETQQHHALIRVTGSDAENFLHAQFSNSVMNMQAGEVRFAAWCNAKGRVWTLLRYWKDGDAYILRLPSDQIEDALKRLRMFVLRSDVQLTPLEWRGCQFIGPDAQTWLEQVKKQTSGQSYRLDLPLAWPACELWHAELPDNELPQVPAEASALPRILAGQPEIYASQREAWIPQMLNLDRLDGIDFKKGCYPGQEIVAKLHYKGGLKQRMYTGHVRDSARPGDDLQNSQGKTIGQVLEAANLSDQSWFTAVLRLEALNDVVLLASKAIDILHKPA